MNDVENPTPPACPPPIISAFALTAAPPLPPWKFWATTGLGAGLLAIYIVTQSFVVVGWLAFQALQHQGKIELDVAALSMDGDVLGSAIVLGSPLTIFFAALFIKLRQGPTLRDYLGLHWPKWWAVAGWSLGMIAVLCGGELLTHWLKHETVPESMLTVYRTAAFKPLLWLGIIVVGPAVEEVIFRGFLFRGWQESRLGNWGTILLTALLWAAIHLQYDLFGIAIIFAYGIFFGLVRLRTGSVWFCLALHCALNLIATIQVELYLATP